MARVFISHSSKNDELAAEVRGWLRENGHDVFLDYHRHDGIEGGDRWEERLYERLRWADAVLCIVTGDYEMSRWCFGEIVAAKTLGSRLLPLIAEEGVNHSLLGDLEHVIYHGAHPQARERICGILREIDATGGAGWPDGRSPFPGLRAFDVDMHRAFFGRRREVDDLVRLLRSLIDRGEGRIVVVVGPSGCGKSSLVRAGLLPAMADEPGWATLAPFVPGTDPVSALSQELAQRTRRTPSQIRRQLGKDNGLVLAVEELLRAGTSPPRRRLLVVIDQFEEILTRSSATGRVQLAEMLQPAATGPLQVVVTLRSEFLDSLLADPHLAQLSIHSLTVRPLDTAVLPLVIQGPARLAGLGVDPELVSRMVADTASGDALPLLAFTLERLTLDLPRGATLSRERYAELGGVRGALIRQADLALDNALAANQRAGNGRSRTDVFDSLLRLVTVDEMGQPTRLEVDYQRLPPPVQVELEAFIDARLLTSSKREGTVLLGVTHEAFLTTWPPLTQAISAAGAALRMRRRLEQAAAEWEHADRKSSFLWEREQLAAAVSEIGVQLRRVDSDRTGAENTITDRLRALRGHHEVASGRVELGPAVRAFLQTSIRHQQRRRRLFLTAVAAALVVAFTVTTNAVIQRQIAEDQTELATVRGLVAQAEARRGSDPRLALQLGIAAHRIRPTVETGTSLSTTLTSTRLTVTLTGHTSSVYAVAFSPGGQTLATASDDHTVGLWDISDRTHPTRTATLTGHSGLVYEVAFSLDGQTLATASADHTARLWDMTDRIHPARVAPLSHTSVVYGVAFSPDGQTLATASADNTAGLWDMTDRIHPARTATLSHTGPVSEVAFSPDGQVLATTSYDNTVGLWDISDRIHPARTATLRHIDAVNGVAFSPDGQTLATGSDDNTAGLWDITDRIHPARIATLRHTNTVSGVAFSPDGRTLATASYDNTVGLWDVSDRIHPARIATLRHTDTVWGVAFSPDGQTLATSSADTTVGLWDVSDRIHPARTATLTGHTGLVYGVAFSPDGQTLATASADNTVGLWDITGRIHPARTATLGHTNTVYGVVFSPDGRTLATASDDNTGGLWDLRGVLKLSGHLANWACTAAGGGLAQEQWDTFAPGVPYRPTC